MDIETRSGDVWGQHPDDVVIYRFARTHAAPPQITQLLPPAGTADLVVEPLDAQRVRVSGGRGGVLYRLTWEADTVDVRVTAKGLYRAARDGQGRVVLHEELIYGVDTDGARIVVGSRMVPTLEETAVAPGLLALRRDGLQRPVPVAPPSSEPARAPRRKAGAYTTEGD